MIGGGSGWQMPNNEVDSSELFNGNRQWPNTYNMSMLFTSIVSTEK